MEKIWDDLVSYEWWFNTVIAGLAVGLASAFVYDWIKRKTSLKKKKDDLGLRLPPRFRIINTYSTSPIARLCSFLIFIHCGVLIIAGVIFFLSLHPQENDKLASAGE
jgi:type II secretory pathway component PulF